MPTAIQTQVKPTNRGRGRGGNRGKGRGRGGDRGGPGHSQVKGKESVPEPVPEPVVEAVESKENATKEDKESPSDDAEACWICAEPVKYFSVSQCNHRTCHVCALRLRALWKRLDCTFCKVRCTYQLLESA